MRILLDLNPVASMHFARHPSNNCRGGSRLNVKNHHFTNDLAWHERTMLFHFARSDRFIAIATITVFVFCAICHSSGAAPTITSALETGVTVGSHVFSVPAIDVAAAKRAIDG